MFSRCCLLVRDLARSIAPWDWTTGGGLASPCRERTCVSVSTGACTPGVSGYPPWALLYFLPASWPLVSVLSHLSSHMQSSAVSTALPICSYFTLSKQFLIFLDFIYLFMRDREAETQTEKQASPREPNAGLDPGTPRSYPELKGDMQLLRHPGIPQSFLRQF